MESTIESVESVEYNFLKRICRGKFAEVFDGEEVDVHGRVVPVAIKVMELKSQALFELDILEKIRDGPHIVRCLNDFELDGNRCIVFEKLDCTLFEVLQNSKKHGQPGLSLPLIRKLARQIAHALAHLQKNHVIHGDIKPENVMFKNRKRANVKLIDFGLSSENECDLLPMQSLFYRAPEVVFDGRGDHKIDVWSFGALLFELFTGAPLFEVVQEEELATKMLELTDLQSPADRMLALLRRCDVPMQYWKPRCKDLVRFLGLLERTLRRDPESRISAVEILCHPFFCSVER